MRYGYIGKTFSVLFNCRTAYITKSKSSFSRPIKGHTKQYLMHSVLWHPKNLLRIQAEMHSIQFVATKSNTGHNPTGGIHQFHIQIGQFIFFAVSSIIPEWWFRRICWRSWLHCGTGKNQYQCESRRNSKTWKSGGRRAMWQRITELSGDTSNCRCDS